MTILVIFGYNTLLFLLAGVVLVGEKNEWATRQVIQAICLSFAADILTAVFGLFDFVYRIPFIGSAWGTIIGIITGLVRIAVWVFAIIAIVKTAKGKEAGVPLADKFANWAYGKVVPKPVYQQPASQPVQQPVAQPVQQAAPAQPTPQPVAQAQPVQQPAPQPANACAKCGAPLTGGSFCSKCGAPVNQ